MQNLISYFVGCLLAFLILKHSIKKVNLSWTKGDIIICSILALGSWISLIMILLMLTDQKTEEKFKNVELPDNDDDSSRIMVHDNNS